MPVYRCPHPSHGEAAVPLKSNNERVYECEQFHKFYGRDEAGAPVLVDLITSAKHPLVPLDPADSGPSRPRLNFMNDVLRPCGSLDFDRLSLSAAEWKLLSRVDGRCTLEEVRLLAGLRADEVERLVWRLVDAGILEFRGRK